MDKLNFQTNSDLSHQAEQLGISLAHYDIDGHLIQAKPESLAYFVDLLKPCSQRQDYDDVIVATENEPIEYDLSTLIADFKQPINVKISAENNRTIANLTISHSILYLAPLPFGYYQLQLSQAQQAYRLRLLVAPALAYQPEVFQQHKSWGVNVQLYSLRSAQNWGIGDFGDLRYLIEQSAQYGADFVGINPLHQLYAAEPEWASPYSSSSRRWLNFVYLDIGALPEFKLCKSAQNWFAQQDIQSQLAALREQDRVDYEKIFSLKLTALEQLFAFAQRSKSKSIIARRAEFARYQQEQGAALQYQALFNVLDQQAQRDELSEENIGWLGWRAEWQQLSEKKRQALLKQYAAEVEFFAWLQWLTEQQLAELQQYCAEVGMKLGIYGDLAVNSSRGSADVWADPDLYCVNASVGAPPDPLGPVGQNWNLPPYNPSQLKARGFQPFIDMLRANMRHFGVLRIDHVMGLFRLWLIPEGKTAADGVYVRYPFDALMAILAIESQRNQCLIIGEDLGTVPDEVRWKLNEFQIFSYFVLYFSQRDRQFPLGAHFPQNAFATIGTHDVPSLQSFWHCRDLELFGALAILNGDILRQKYDQRVIDKQALLDTLHRDQYLPPDYQGDALSMAMHDNLNAQIHRYLAHSGSKLVGVQLENLISQEVSFNLPGTSTEYPNWRCKLAQSLEQIFSYDSVKSLLTSINQARKA